MDSRTVTLPFKSPYTHSNSIFIQYIEALMRLTYDHPELMKYIVYLMGISSVALLPSYFLLPAVLSVPTPIAGMASAMGLSGFLFSGFNALTQHTVIGLPTHLEDKCVYQNKKYAYGDAKASLVVNRVDMPILYISAKNHYDAGYTEGYILGGALRYCLQKINVLMKMLLYFFEVPDSILKTIPKRFQDEMRGKIEGYNQWLKDNHINEKLSFKDYLIIQLLPDLTSNYLPVSKQLQSLLKPLHFFGFGCTTIAIRLKKYTAFLRLLDWPAFGGSSYIFQVSRNISGSKRTIDVSLPALSGALTVLNENALLIEMNVSSGNKGSEIKGTPSVFFNRDCAENSASVKDVESFINANKPLVAYNLTATDGKETKSFRLYQNKSDINKHAIETLAFSKNMPQLLVVANEGIELENKTIKKTNHRDSFERRQNIHHFFYKHVGKFKSFIAKQKGSKRLDENDMYSLKKLLLQVAGLDLVNNFATALCAMYIFQNTQQRLIDASAVTDNAYAPSRGLEEFRRLRRL